MAEKNPQPESHLVPVGVGRSALPEPAEGVSSGERYCSLFFLSALHALLGRYDLIRLHGTDASYVLPLLRLSTAWYPSHAVYRDVSPG